MLTNLTTKSAGCSNIANIMIYQNPRIFILSISYGFHGASGSVVFIGETGAWSFLAQWGHVPFNSKLVKPEIQESFIFTRRYISNLIWFVWRQIKNTHLEMYKPSKKKTQILPKRDGQCLSLKTQGFSQDLYLIIFLGGVLDQLKCTNGD